MYICELASYKRLMIAGMLADLTVEHQSIVRQTDVADPDPVEVPQLMRRFVVRMELLFMQGEVLRMEHSFTAQISKFLKKPSVLLVKKMRFCLPDQLKTLPNSSPLSGCVQLLGMCCAASAQQCQTQRGRYVSPVFFAQPAGPLEAWSTSSESVDAESIHRYIPAGKAREP